MGRKVQTAVTEKGLQIVKSLKENMEKGYKYSRCGYKVYCKKPDEVIDCKVSEEYKQGLYRMEKDGLVRIVGGVFSLI